MEQETADCLSISAAEHNSSVNNTNHQSTGKNVIANFLALLSTNYFAQDKFLFKPSRIDFSHTRVCINHELWWNFTSPLYQNGREKTNS